MWEMFPKAQFLCCFQLFKLPLKTNRDSRPFQQAIIRQNRLRNRFRRAFLSWAFKKRLKSHGILHDSINQYICVERGKTREVRDGNRNCKNLILFVKISLENKFLYLPPWQSRVKFYESKFSKKSAWKFMRNFTLKFGQISTTQNFLTVQNFKFPITQDEHPCYDF